MRRNMIVIAWILGSLLAWRLGMYAFGYCMFLTAKEVQGVKHLDLMNAMSIFVSWSSMLIVPGLFTVLAITGRLPGTRKSGDPPPAPAHWFCFLWSAGSIALFAIACMLPACQTTSDRFFSGPALDDIWGYQALILGFLYLAWWANPLWLLGNLFLLLRRYRLALWFALGAVILASIVWVYPLVPIKGGPPHIVQVYIGAVFWWASMVVLLAGSLMHWWRFHKARATPMKQVDTKAIGPRRIHKARTPRP